jgi:hypothetical protein
MQQMTTKIQNEKMHMYKHVESNLIFQPASVAIHLNTHFSDTFLSIQVRARAHARTHMHTQGYSGVQVDIV